MNCSGVIDHPRCSTDFQRCSKQFLSEPSLLQSMRDLVTLYSTGVSELVRQLFSASPQPIPSSTNYRRNLDDLKRQRPIIVVTGGASGIGRSLLEILRPIALNIILLAHPRSYDSSVKVDRQILIDFTSYESVIFGTDALIRHLITLPKHQVVLFHCAAVYNPREKIINRTEDCTSAGVTFQTNTIMPTLFLHQLREAVDVTVLIGSSAQHCAPIIDETICPLCNIHTTYAAYPMSKLIMLANTALWGRIWGKRVIVIHPGIVATSLYDNEPGIRGILLRAIIRNLAWTPHQSAVRILQVIFSANVLNSTPEQRRTGGQDNQACPSSQIYWDTVSMCPAPLPTQIAHSSDSRTSIDRWTFGHFSL